MPSTQIIKTIFVVVLFIQQPKVLMKYCWTTFSAIRSSGGISNPFREIIQPFQEIFQPFRGIIQAFWGSTRPFSNPGYA